jgi:hypothetical protein
MQRCWLLNQFVHVVTTLLLRIKGAARQFSTQKQVTWGNFVSRRGRRICVSVIDLHVSLWPSWRPRNNQYTQLLLDYEMNKILISAKLFLTLTLRNSLHFAIFDLCMGCFQTANAMWPIYARVFCLFDLSVLKCPHSRTERSLCWLKSVIIQYAE